MQQWQEGCNGCQRSGHLGLVGWDVDAWDEQAGENLIDRLMLRMLAALDGRREARVGRLREAQPSERESAGYEVEHPDGKREAISA